MATWVTLKSLHEQTGLATRSLQYIAAQEPGVLVTRVKGSKTEYKQPDCAINLRKREAAMAVAKVMSEKQATPSELAAARRATADAEIAEAKVAQLRREWLPRDDVRLELRTFAHELRSAIDAFPGKHAHRVIGLTDLTTATVALRTIANAVLATLHRMPLGAGQEPEASKDAAA